MKFKTIEGMPASGGLEGHMVDSAYGRMQFDEEGNYHFGITLERQYRPSVDYCRLFLNGIRHDMTSVLGGPGYWAYQCILPTDPLSEYEKVRFELKYRDELNRPYFRKHPAGGPALFFTGRYFGAGPRDADGDGILDLQDNCPCVPWMSPGSDSDTDSDGLGDSCDPFDNLNNTWSATHDYFYAIQDLGQGLKTRLRDNATCWPQGDTRNPEAGEWLLTMLFEDMYGRPIYPFRYIESSTSQVDVEHIQGFQSLPRDRTITVSYGNLELFRNQRWAGGDKRTLIYANRENGYFSISDGTSTIAEGTRVLIKWVLDLNTHNFIRAYGTVRIDNGDPAFLSDLGSHRRLDFMFEPPSTTLFLYTPERLETNTHEFSMDMSFKARQ
ncbi:MAG: thrombospondin type 3 repeat-containing protein [Promethearchaeota archaeon]